MTAARLAVGRAFTALVCVAALVNLATLVPRFVVLIRTGDGVPDTILAGLMALPVIAGMGACLLALTIVLRSWQFAGAQSLAIFLAAAATAWGTVLRGFTIDVHHGSIHANMGGHDPASLLPAFLLLATVMLAAASFLRFSALFPAPLRLPGRPGRIHQLRRALLRGRVVWTLALIAPSIALAMVVLWVLFLPGNEDGGGGTAAGILIFVAFSAFPVACMAFGIANLRTGYAAAADADRRQLLWLVNGVVIGTGMLLAPIVVLLVLLVTPIIPEAWVGNSIFISWSLAPAVLVAAISVAVFYNGAVDPALVLRRTTILAVLGIAWIALFAVLETLFSNWIIATLGIPETMTSVLVALGAAAAALPFRRLVPARADAATGFQPAPETERFEQRNAVSQENGGS